ncbi:SDR family oxidoreductase [Paraburkholderia sp. LEh10]|nr:SDR family oxidoreductase [Paraburkholderia sp. LEh10]
MRNSNSDRKVVLITGAGIGIGRATAKAFGAPDYTVLVTDVLHEEGEAVAAEIRDAGGSATHYSAAKAGVVGPVRGLAVELGRHGIRANGLALGFIRTAQALSEQHSKRAAGLAAVSAPIPRGRVGEPEDMADVITFMASDKARYLSGQTILVDGGFAIQSH